MAQKASRKSTWSTKDGYKERFTAKILREDLEYYLHLPVADLPKEPDARALIAPHIRWHDYVTCAAPAFAAIDPLVVWRVFILGPALFHSMEKCALSRASVWECPLGDLPVDLERVFEDIDMIIDEAEYNLDRHLPCITMVFQLRGRPVKIVPILVGNFSYESQIAYGKIFAKYIDNPANFFCVSSNFCAWGSRYNFTYYEKRLGPIHKSIEALDRAGMKIIESGDPAAFRKYLEDYENTISGRRAIGVLLHMLKECGTKMEVKFLNYSQSDQICIEWDESSVSFASAVAVVSPPISSK